jgi:hypothetical protein
MNELEQVWRERNDWVQASFMWPEIWMVSGLEMW